MTGPERRWVGRVAGIDIEVAAVDAVTAAVDLAVAGLFTREVSRLAGGMEHLDRALQRAPTRLRDEGVFTGAASSSILIRHPPAPIMSGAILVVGLGEPSEFAPEVLANATRRTFDTAMLLGAQSIAFAPSILDGGLVPDGDENLSQAMVTGIAQSARAARRLAALGFSPPSPLVCWRFAASPAHLAKAADAFRRAVAGTPDPRE